MNLEKFKHLQFGTDEMTINTWSYNHLVPLLNEDCPELIVGTSNIFTTQPTIWPPINNKLDCYFVAY
jgi:hypothetical protein